MCQEDRLAFQFPSDVPQLGALSLSGDLCLRNYGTPGKKGLLLMGALSSRT